MIDLLQYLFIPHEKNNHKPKVFHLSSLFFLILLIGTFQASLTFLTRLYPGVLGFASNIAPERVIELTNQRRAEQGLSTLSLSPLLVEAARQKAAEMFAFGCWSHNCHDRTPWWFFKNVGYEYLYAGENLAKDFADPESAVNAWMNSESHRDNVLNSKYKEIGIAVVDGTLNGEETTLIVQMFGAPSKATSLISTAKQTAVQGEAVKNIKPAEIKEKIPETLEKVPEILVVQKEIADKLPKISTFTLTKLFYLFLVMLLIGVLIIDGIIISHKQIVRISGKSVIHLSFFLIILISILLSKAGKII